MSKMSEDWTVSEKLLGLVLDISAIVGFFWIFVHLVWGLSIILNMPARIEALERHQAYIDILLQNIYDETHTTIEIGNSLH